MDTYIFLRGASLKAKLGIHLRFLEFLVLFCFCFVYSLFISHGYFGVCVYVCVCGWHIGEGVRVGSFF